MTAEAHSPADVAAAKRGLDELGYHVVPEAIGAAGVRALRARLEQQAAAEKELGIAFEDGGPGQNPLDAGGRIRRDGFTAAAGGVNQRVWMLVNKGRAFRDLVLHPLVADLVGHVLGPDFLLSNYSANIARPGGVAMALHTDQWWMPASAPPEAPHIRPGALTRTTGNPAGGTAAIAPAVVCNVIWMLNAFSENNGATRIVPRSHLSGRQPEVDAARAAVPATGAAGSALVYDGRLWHGTGANRSDEARLGVIMTFCGPQFRTQENYTLATAPEVLAEASPALLARLGFRVWNGYGRIEHPGAEFVSRRDALVGELTPEGKR